MKITYKATQGPLRATDDWITGVILEVNGVIYHVDETDFEGELRLRSDQRIGIMPDSPTSVTISTDVRVME